MHLLAISGSLREKSYNTALLRAAAQCLPEDVTLDYANIVLPLYNADLTEAQQEGVGSLRDQITDAGAVLIATPEYNYGIPGALKNAIDWASRPAYRSPFADKPVGIIGAAPGSVGTARAQGQLKQVLLGMAAQVFPYPEFLVSGAGSKFDDNGQLVDQDTVTHLDKFLSRFVGWAKKVA